MKVWLVTPPLLQTNTPYPAMPVLSGHLKSLGHDPVQSDLSIELLLAIFSKAGLKQLHALLLQSTHHQSPSVQHFVAHYGDYEASIEPVIRFLQGQDEAWIYRIASRNFLPEGPRFLQIQDSESLEWAFGRLGVRDQALHFASLYLDDLADAIREGVDPEFGFSRYAEKLAASAPSFDGLKKALESNESIIVKLLRELTVHHLKEIRPDLVAITAPFAGNVFFAFKIAQIVRETFPGVPILLGGGFVNTELRELKDESVFDYFDFITFDDGEQPLEAILNFINGKSAPSILVRTFHKRKEGQINYCHTSPKPLTMNERALPDYAGVQWNDYFSMFEMLNPVNRLWTEGRWIKLTLAHGCYWKKCTFCDLSLDYIGRYDPMKAKKIVDQMLALSLQTGITGFHFVDEAAPPALLRAVSQEIIDRGCQFSWWGNIRFEKTFTSDLVELMAQAGCIAVTGGLEVASPRILALIQKGVSLEQAAQVTHSFSKVGILVHAYLMYGFPSQTYQEAAESLEFVRQLFLNGCIHSGFWHRFSATVHSPVGQDPDRFQIKLLSSPSGNSSKTFSKNDLPFFDPQSDCDWDEVGAVLRSALYNYMHGLALDDMAGRWFYPRKAKVRLPKDFVKKVLYESPES